VFPEVNHLLVRDPDGDFLRSDLLEQARLTAELFATTRSSLPTWLISPFATEIGEAPAANSFLTPKGAIAISRPHRDRSAGVARDHQIGPGVTVHVPDRDRVGTEPGGLL
jgi:hypothetical protein